MAQIRRGETVKKGLKFFVYGAYGTRKSSFGLHMARLKSEVGRPLRVLFIDAESGSIDNYLDEFSADYGVDLRNILIIYTTSYAETEKYCKIAISKKPIMIENEDGDEEEALDADGETFVADVIVLDGSTVLQDNVKYAALNVSEKRARIRAMNNDKLTNAERSIAEATAGLEFKDWDKIKMRGKNLLRQLITGTDQFVVVTAREKEKKKMVGGTMVSEGVVPDCWDGAEYEFFTVIHNFIDEDGNVFGQIMAKDRTGQFKPFEIIENPTPALWQPIIDGNKGKSEYRVVHKNMEADIANDESAVGGGAVLDEQLNSDSGDKSPEQEHKELLEACLKIKAGLSPLQKKSLKPMLDKANLPTGGWEDLDLEKLQALYEIINR